MMCLLWKPKTAFTDHKMCSHLISRTAFLSLYCNGCVDDVQKASSNISHKRIANSVLLN